MRADELNGHVQNHVECLALLPWTSSELFTDIACVTFEYGDSFLVAQGGA